jgi:sugar phosphate isomerase/epimerase
MFKLGFNSAILADFSFEHMVNFAAQHGFGCVEVMCWPKENADTRRYAGVSHIDVVNLNQQKINEIRHTLRTANVSISALGYYPNPLDPDREKADYFIEHIKEVIRGAAKLAIPVVTTFVGRDPAKNISDNLIDFARIWPAIVKVAEENNVKLAIENCPMFFTNDEWPGGKNLAISPSVWSRMFEIIPSPSFGLNYDPSHMIWQMMDEIKPIYQFRERLHHVHLKDVKVYKDKLDQVGILANPLEYHSPKLPGLGDVRWRDFFAALTDVRYRGPVVIEVEDKAYETDITDVKSAILTSRNYVNQFLG